MIKAVTKIDASKLDQMPLTISLTATVAEWRDLMRQMTSEWPSADLGRAISRCLGHVARSTEATFTDPMHAADED